MTDDDKLVAFETAINLMLEAQERLSDAEKLFNKCGIELCDTFSWGDAAKERCSFTNAQFTRALKILRNFPELPDILSMIALQAKRTKADGTQNTTV